MISRPEYHDGNRRPLPAPKTEPRNGVVPEHASSLTLLGFFGVVRRNLWMVMLGALITALPIIMGVMRQPPVYTATAQVRLVDKRAAMTGGLTEQMLGRNTDAILSQIEVLRGRRVIGQVVDDLGLRLGSATAAFPFGMLRDVHVDDAAAAEELKLAFAADGVQVTSGRTVVNGRYGVPISVAGVSFVVPERPEEVESAELYLMPREKAIDLVLSKLDADPVERTDAVLVSYSAGDPRTAQRVANAIVETFQYSDMSMAQQEAHRQRIFLETQLAEADSVLREVEGTLSGFRRDRQLFSSRDMVSVQQQSLLSLEEQRAMMQSELDISRRFLPRLDSSDPAARLAAIQELVSLPGVAANAVVGLRYSQLTEARAELDRLVSGGVLGDRLLNAENLVRTTEEELRNTLRSHVSVYEGQVAALGELRGQRAQQMSGLPADEIEEMRLQQQVDQVRALTLQLTGDLQRARMSQAVEAGQVQVVYDAPLPIEPEENGLVWKSILGILLGMLLGSGGALLRESMNTAIRAPNDIEQNLGIAELAVVPHATRAEGRGLIRGREVARIGPHGSPDLAMLEGAGAIGAEAYRMLRTNLMYAQARNGLSSLVVTSPAPGEGKTTTIANLAVAFAQQGQRVLLVDCDLRRPRIHKVFGTGQAPGLSDVLTGASPLRNALRTTQIEDLTVVTSGSTSEKPAELLGSERMKQLVQFLAEGFDLVLLDTPPVLAAAEAMSLSTLVDGVVLVVRAGQTDREEARQAVQQLADVGAEVFGAVLNDPDEAVSRYGGGYKYYKYYTGAAS